MFILDFRVIGIYINSEPPPKISETNAKSLGLSKEFLEKSFSSSLKEARRSFEKEYLITQLKKNHGNISKTADFIGMERSALHRKLKELGIKGIN